ncbi:U11/U12 small nuclear ribonucleoprotein 48 kDa protein-like [Littorina saxatilis]|uniref:CHHC U11-48K-type domain-containing protein n=1 Tax=Littorina saxatilis TaxID=31220 RepID=A0AAN9BDD0_9CAEN
MKENAKDGDGPTKERDKRRRFMSEMKSFIEEECLEIGEILNHMSWTPDHILKGCSKVQCAHDPGHHVPESSLKQHTAACFLRKMGLSEQDMELQLQDEDFVYRNADLVGKVELDEGLLNRIIWNHCMENRQVHMGHRSMPVGANDWMVKLSPQERLAVYDYCVDQLKAQGKMANVEQDEVLTTDWERIIKKNLLEQGGQKPKSKVELLAMLRDQKRRRQSYRAKNVHVTKKSYTEIIREVILNQIEIMMPSSETEQTSRQEETPEHIPDKLSEASSRHHSPSSSRHQSRHRTRSRSPKRKRSRKSRSRSPRRKKSRSHSPRVSSRHGRDASGSRETEDARTERRYSCYTQSSRQEEDKVKEEAEEGEVESDDNEHPERQRSSRKKSSKHKKHKHKKHKRKSSQDNLDDGN